MKRIVRLLIVLVPALSPMAVRAEAPTAVAQSAAAGIRLGCVSLQRVFSESAEGKAALARLTALHAEKARAIGALSLDIHSAFAGVKGVAAKLRLAAGTTREGC